MNNEEILGCIVVIEGERLNKGISQKKFYEMIATDLDRQDKSIKRFLSLKNQKVATSRKNNINNVIDACAKYLEIAPYEIRVKAKLYAKLDSEIKNVFWQLKESRCENNNNSKEEQQQKKVSKDKECYKASRKHYVENYKKYIDEKYNIEFGGEQREVDDLCKTLDDIKKKMAGTEKMTGDMSKAIKQVGDGYLIMLIEEHYSELFEIEKKLVLIMSYYNILKKLDDNVRKFLLILIKINEEKKLRVKVDDKLNELLTAMRKHTEILLNKKSNKDIFGLVSLRYINSEGAQTETLQNKEIIDMGILVDAIHINGCDENLKIDCLCKTINFMLVSKENQKKLLYELEAIFDKEAMPLIRREIEREILLHS